MIKANDYKPGSPEWAMAKFFSCWKRRAWTQILDYVQPSWLSRYEDPKRTLRLSLHKLIDADFRQMNANTGIAAVFLVEIYGKGNTFSDRSIRAVRLVREGKKWGVNPSSII